MDHELELISPVLEILEIEVCNILYSPGHIEKLSFSIFSCPRNDGKLSCSIFSYSGNTGKNEFSYFLLSWKYVAI